MRGEAIYRVGTWIVVEHARHHSESFVPTLGHVLCELPRTYEFKTVSLLQAVGGEAVQPSSSLARHWLNKFAKRLCQPICHHHSPHVRRKWYNTLPKETFSMVAWHHSLAKLITAVAVEVPVSTP
jgi:hypothetical protein